MTFLSTLVLPECVIMLAWPEEEGAGQGEGCEPRGVGERQNRQRPPSSTSKTLQCCHLQAKTFKADSINTVF